MFFVHSTVIGLSVRFGLDRFCTPVSTTILDTLIFIFEYFLVLIVLVSYKLTSFSNKYFVYIKTLDKMRVTVNRTTGTHTFSVQFGANTCPVPPYGSVSDSKIRYPPRYMCFQNFHYQLPPCPINTRSSSQNIQKLCTLPLKWICGFPLRLFFSFT